MSDLFTQINSSSALEKCVSVIIPAYNTDSSIAASVASALNQVEVTVEVIVVDNGKNQNLMKNLGEYTENVRLIKQSIIGAGPARNLGAVSAKFEIIAFLDAGDTWNARKLSEQLKDPLNNFELRGTYATFRTKKGKRIGTTVRTSSNEEATIIAGQGLGVPAITSSWCMRKSTFFSTGLFDPSFESSQDLDFMNRLVNSGGKITVIREELVDYYLDSKSLTVSNYKRQFLSAEFIRSRNLVVSENTHTLELFLKMNGNFPSNLWFKTQAGRFFRLALIKLGDGLYTSFFALLTLSLILDPKNFFKKLTHQSILFKL